MISLIRLIQMLRLIWLSIYEKYAAWNNSKWQLLKKKLWVLLYSLTFLWQNYVKSTHLHLLSNYTMLCSEWEIVGSCIAAQFHEIIEVNSIIIWFYVIFQNVLYFYNERKEFFKRKSCTKNKYLILDRKTPKYRRTLTEKWV